MVALVPKKEVEHNGDNLKRVHVEIGATHLVVLQTIEETQAML